MPTVKLKIPKELNIVVNGRDIPVSIIELIVLLTRGTIPSTLAAWHDREVSRFVDELAMSETIKLVIEAEIPKDKITVEKRGDTYMIRFGDLADVVCRLGEEPTITLIGKGPRVEELNRKIRELEQKVRDYEAKLREYEEKLREREKQIKEYEGKIRECEVKIRQLTEELARHRRAEVVPSPVRDEVKALYNRLKVALPSRKVNIVTYTASWYDNVLALELTADREYKCSNIEELICEEAANLKLNVKVTCTEDVKQRGKFKVKIEVTPRE